MQNLKIYYLIGMSGAGKTYWGQAISTHITTHFIDLDKTIEERTGFQISKFFELKGEDYFRQLESRILRDCVKFGKAIIATGGGTPCFYNNIQWMNGTGKTIWLNTSLHKIFENIKNELDVRPLFNGLKDEQVKAKIEETFQERQPYYALAKYTLNDDQTNLNNFLKIFKEL